MRAADLHEYRIPLLCPESFGLSFCGLWDKEIGSLEPGKKADVAIYDTSNPDWLPLYNPISNLVYSSPGSSVRTVIVDGAVVMEGGCIQTVDEEALYKEVRKRQEHILKITGLGDSIQTSWPIR
ncbi:amidohydrolase family protein [Acidobacteria bacterium AH-259-D05]|nr:amidohydrolase family protein [Acidobacteria bacterium AH-259-D05]